MNRISVCHHVPSRRRLPFSRSWNNLSPIGGTKLARKRQATSEIEKPRLCDSCNVCGKVRTLQFASNLCYDIYENSFYQLTSESCGIKPCPTEFETSRLPPYLPQPIPDAKYV